MPNSAKSSNDFSETTGQILMKLGHNDHLVGIRIYTEKSLEDLALFGPAHQPPGGSDPYQV